MNIYDQLQAVEDRYEELGELLSDPEVVSDTKRFMELSSFQRPLSPAGCSWESPSAFPVKYGNPPS